MSIKDDEFLAAMSALDAHRALVFQRDVEAAETAYLAAKTKAIESRRAAREAAESARYAAIKAARDASYAALDSTKALVSTAYESGSEPGMTVGEAITAFERTYEPARANAALLQDDHDHPSVRQIAGFLDRVRTLDESDWEVIARDARLAAAAFGMPPTWERDAYQDDQSELRDFVLGHVFKAVGLDEMPGRTLPRAVVAGNAALALTFADDLSVAEFSASYGPFGRVIPVLTLPLGNAAGGVVFPDSATERFVTRIQRLTEADWEQVAHLSEERDAALGLTAVEAAILQAEAVRSETETAHAALGIWWQQVGPFSGTADVWRGFARVLQKSEFWAAGRFADRWAHREEVSRHATWNALLAVASQSLVPVNVSATLYLPFAGLVPLASLSIDDG